MFRNSILALFININTHTQTHTHIYIYTLIICILYLWYTHDTPIISTLGYYCCCFQLIYPWYTQYDAPKGHVSGWWQGDLWHLQLAMMQQRHGISVCIAVFAAIIHVYQCSPCSYFITYIYTYIFTCIHYTQVHIYIYIHIYNIYTYLFTYTYTYIAYIHMYIHIYTYVYTYIYIYTYNIYIYRYRYTYIHICRHISALRQLCQQGAPHLLRLRPKLLRTCAKEHHCLLVKNHQIWGKFAIGWLKAISMVEHMGRN